MPPADREAQLPALLSTEIPDRWFGPIVQHRLSRRVCFRDFVRGGKGREIAMRRLRACLTFGFTLSALLALAQGASAKTFYVEGRGSNSSECGTVPNKGGLQPPDAPCETIQLALEKAEKSAPPNTIKVSGETYDETLFFTNERLRDLTIEPEGRGEVITLRPSVAGFPTIVTNSSVDSLTLSGFKMYGEPSGKEVILNKGAELSLYNDYVEAEETENGVYSEKFDGKGSLSVESSIVNMESGTTGFGIESQGAVLHVDHSRIETGAAAQSEAGGVDAEEAPSVSITNSQIFDGSALSSTSFAVALGHDAATELVNDNVKQGSPAMGVVFEDTPADVNGLLVEMQDASSGGAAMAIEGEPEAPPSAVRHLTVDGTWKGVGLYGEGELTLADSHITTGPLSTVPSLFFGGSASVRGLLVQRSELQASPTAPVGVRVWQGNAIFDSSALFGGATGLEYRTYNSSHPVAGVLTLSSSTVDAGAPGTAADAAGVVGVRATVLNGTGLHAIVHVQGSVILENQAATEPAGDEAAVTCSYSAAPSQVASAGAGAGAISCLAGKDGDTTASTALFAGPLTTFENLTAYEPAVGSAAVDRVPASAVRLPSGVTPSSTDLLGNPRVVSGKRNCTMVQDMGALELQTQRVPCITRLRLRPSSFKPAHKGASLVRRGKGAKLTWVDSEAATVKFTVLAPEAGRLNGRSCVPLTHVNAGHKHCTAYRRVGAFKHSDSAGANSGVFTGRVGGRALRAGHYLLQALASNSRGHGVKVAIRLRIR
jgi:hypothetical protein